MYFGIGNLFYQHKNNYDSAKELSIIIIDRIRHQLFNCG